MHLEVRDGSSAFKIRSAALIVRDGRVLLNRLRGDDVWMLPGGTGEFGESAEETLRRELREELGVEASVGRLLWVVEHFFELTGRRWHQVLWIYEASLPGDVGSEDGEWERASSDGAERFLWADAAALRSLRVVPGFLPGAVADPPHRPVHLTHRDLARHDRTTPTNL
jgi:8-oxo-dGTP pyrophosphatase MutT (NUDIX family)